MDTRTPERVGRADVSRSQLLLFAHAFGINHAAVTTPILYQTTYLGTLLGNRNNAVLYAVTMVTALFAAAPLADRLGPRLSLTGSMLGYAVYAALFAFAITCRHTFITAVDGSSDVQPGYWMHTVGILGSLIGGLVAGVLWTSQGVIMGHLIEDAALTSEKSNAKVSAEMWSIFGLWFLIWEAVMRAVTTAMLQAGISPAITFGLFGVLAAAAAAAFHRGVADDVRLGAVQGGTASVLNKASQAVRLWSDPKIWLLQGINLTFGFAAAWNASYIGPKLIAKALNPNFIGFMGAVTSLIGGISARLLGPFASELYCGKGPIVLCGSLCFLCLALLSLAWPTDRSMGLGVLVFPVLMGLGRAVFESTNKGIFTDVYPSPAQHAGVFSNVMLFGTLSSSIVFALNSMGHFNNVITLLIFFSACTYPCLRLAFCVQDVAESLEETAPIRPKTANNM